MIVEMLVASRDAKVIPELTVSLAVSPSEWQLAGAGSQI